MLSSAPTPHAPASARASQPPTGAPTPNLALALALAAPATTPSIPPPPTFDFLPDLHRLLKRLLEPPSPPPPAATPTPSQLAAEGPLEIQHVATAANDIRLKIQRARRAVLALPDVDRTCEDQEQEMADLEARIAQLKTSLRELGQPPPPADAEDGDQSFNSGDCMDALDFALAQGTEWYASTLEHDQGGGRAEDVPAET
ncbi:hypothetical protein ACEQ8H_005285 [Pleosporales sp. CAS-2024a]